MRHLTIEHPSLYETIDAIDENGQYLTLALFHSVINGEKAAGILTSIPWPLSIKTI